MKARGKPILTPGDVPEGQFYRTPDNVTRALEAAEREHLTRHTTIWEPCCGDGGILKVLDDLGYRTIGTDIVQRWADDDDSGYQIADLYDATEAPARAVIMNPPFGEVTKRKKDDPAPFLQKLFDLGVEYVAMLVPVDWAAAASRQPFLAKHPISRMY